MFENQITQRRGSITSNPQPTPIASWIHTKISIYVSRFVGISDTALPCPYGETRLL